MLCNRFSLFKRVKTSENFRVLSGPLKSVAKASLRDSKKKKPTTRRSSESGPGRSVYGDVEEVSVINRMKGTLIRKHGWDAADFEEMSFLDIETEFLEVEKDFRPES